MKAMATHTRIGPAERIERLLAMNQRLTKEEKVSLFIPLNKNIFIFF